MHPVAKPLKHVLQVEEQTTHNLVIESAKYFAGQTTSHFEEEARPKSGAKHVSTHEPSELRNFGELQPEHCVGRFPLKNYAYKKDIHIIFF